MRPFEVWLQSGSPQCSAHNRADGTGVGKTSVRRPTADENVACRAVSWAMLAQIDRDGFQENIVNGDEYDDRDQSYWTVALAHQTTERWHNSLKVGSAEADEHQNAGYILSPYRTEPVLEVLDQNDPTNQLNLVGADPGL